MALALLSTLNSQLSTAFAQGSLTPPGAPAPTMKTADQIYSKLDPRTIVNAVNTPGDANNLFIITNSGSYYLTTNLAGVSGKNGISIATNNVTLDLNGFSLLGVSGIHYGIDIRSAQTNVTVQNGAISGWGGAGVTSENVTSVNMVFERLNVLANSYGIWMNGEGVVRDCNCQNNLNDGFSCYGGVISGCTADNNGGYGFSVFNATVSGCEAQNNGADGIYAESGTVSGCNVQNNAYDGIDLYGGAMSGCSAKNNTYHGIEVQPGTVSGCSVVNNGLSGILVIGPGSEAIGNYCIGNNTANNADDAGICVLDANNRVEDNHVSASGYAGILVQSVGNNIIIKNSVSGNGTKNYSGIAGNVVGPLITNTVSGIITNLNPWANFSF